MPLPKRLRQDPATAANSTNDHFLLMENGMYWEVWRGVAAGAPNLCGHPDCAAFNGHTQYTFNEDWWRHRTEDEAHERVCDWCRQRLRGEGGRGAGRHTFSKNTFQIDAARQSIHLAAGRSLCEIAFWYIALHAGWSKTPGGSWGEVVSIISELERTKRPYHARLCELSRDFMFELKCVLKQHGWPGKGSTIEYCCMNNRKFLKQVIKEIRSRDDLYRAPGIITVDPNGMGINSTPWDMLIKLSPVVTRLDFIMNINYRDFVRNTGWLNRSGYYNNHDWPAKSFKSLLRKMGVGRLKEALVSRLLKGHNNYVVVVVRQSLIGPLLLGSFWPVNSPEGRAIVDEADMGLTRE